MVYLYDWQVEHTQKLLETLKTKGVAVDGSDTGTGKTYTACAVAKEFLGSRKLLIVCPKAVIPTWERVTKEFGLEPYKIVNVEKLKRDKSILAKGSKYWLWRQTDIFLIVDEAHRFCGLRTENENILLTAKIAKIPMLLLSATISNSPLRFRSIGFVLEFFPSIPSFWNWALQYGAQREEIWVKVKEKDGSLIPKKRTVITFKPESEIGKLGLQKLGEVLCRSGKFYKMSIKNIKNFPDNFIIPETINFQNTNKLKDLYKLRQEVQEKIRQEGKLAAHLIEITKLRQAIELLKVPDIVEMVRDLIEEKAVVLFCNFRETVHEYVKQLQDLNPAVIIGETQNRETEVERFQHNMTRVCIATYGAGGEAISLHDLYGVPRISILNPTWSLVQYIQALGRIHRAGSKSPAIQKLIFASGTLEENVFKRINTHVENLNLLTDIEEIL